MYYWQHYLSTLWMLYKQTNIFHILSVINIFFLVAQDIVVPYPSQVDVILY